MAEGKTLAEVTGHFCGRFGVDCNVIPMSNDDVRTVVDTPGGSLSFQHYFVKYRCEPEAKNIRYVGAAEAGPIFLDRLSGPDLRAVIICPSNPYLSIGPILALPGVRAALANASAPVVAVSPIIGGSAVKGPTAKIMAELGVGATSASIADFYTGVIDGLIVDQADALDVADLAVECHTAETLMTSIDDRIRLAGETVEFADRLRNGKVRRFATSEIRHVTP